MSIITAFFPTTRKFRPRPLLFVIITAFTASSAGPSRAGGPAAEVQDAFSRARAEMVERDLLRRGIKDRRVLAAMNAVPRHLFVPEPLRAAAYEDRPLPIGAGQTISQPYIVAFMSELLELKGEEKVLEIGTGSGYQTAVLSRLARQVYSIEILPSLAAAAEKVLVGLGHGNVRLKVGDGYFGWPDQEPFDAILVTAASPKFPGPLWRQLGEGGRLVMPLGEEHRAQRLMRYRKMGGNTVAEDLTGVLFVPLTGAVRRDTR